MTYDESKDVAKVFREFRDKLAIEDPEASIALDLAESCFTRTITDVPGMLFASECDDGSLWVYRSTMVSEDGRLYRPVRDELASGRWELMSEHANVDSSMFRLKAIERLYWPTGNREISVESGPE